MAAVAAACLAVACLTATAANKPFTNDDLATSAVELEAQIKSDAGTPAKTVDQLKHDADAAFAKNDFRTGMTVLDQIVAAAPNDAATWLRLAHTIQQIRPGNDNERAMLLERASSAAYIAYQRASDRNQEADSLAFLGTLLSQRQNWRPALDALRLSLELREVADVRGQYERLRDQYGFRVLDYSVDADTASPRACFQFSEDVPQRTDFSPFVAVAGTDKPALSVTEKQLCVEGLDHGQTYTVTLRAGLPSVVHETLSKSSDFAIYVRDRKPSVRFSTSAYVLPRTGQQGIPVISVNSKAVAVEIYRISDRNLIDTVSTSGFGAGDFQTSLSRSDIDQLQNSRGVQVWKGTLAVDAKVALNAEVTTAFPVDQAVTDLKPGVYVMVAQAKELKDLDNNYEALATQWFVVSDLGLTAFSGKDGIHVFVNSLATTDAKSGIELKLISRGNEVLATRQTDAAGHALFEQGLANGEGGAAPALLAAADPKGDYAFLNLQASAFDLTDRGVSGRPAPTGLDAFVYAERGVYRSGETAYLTALLRDPQGTAALNTPLTLVVERPDGVEFKRAQIADQGLGGHTLTLPINASAPTGTWHVRAYTDPKLPAIGETTFLVEDYVPDRIEFDLTSKADRVSQGAPADMSVAGRFLYGAPASNLDLDGDVTISAAAERKGFAGYQFGLADDELDPTKQTLDDLPSTDDSGNATFKVDLDKLPSTTHPLQADVTVRMNEPGGRAVEHKLTLPITPAANMIGIKPLFQGTSLADGASANFDVIVAAPDGETLAQSGLHYQLLRIQTHYQFYKRDGVWNFEPVKTTTRVADGKIDVAPDQPGRISLPVNFGRYRLDVASADPNGPDTSVNFDAGWYVDANADTPDMLQVALDKPEYHAGDTMTVAVTARNAGQVTLNIVGDHLLATQTATVKEGATELKVPVGRDWGTGAYIVATLRRPLDAPAQRMPGRAIGLQWFAIDKAAKTLTVDMSAPALLRPNTTLHVPLKVSGLAAGEEARIAVAAVDVGILNLTNYKPPSASDYYLGQRALSADIRDLYGQLIDGMQGTRGEIRSGGDEGAQLHGSPPTGPPVALYSGIVTVGKDGTADIAFDIPDFAGTVRVMAVAWSKDKVGQGTADVTVRDPVVLSATVPRFLLPGDRSNVHLDLDNVEGQPGDYTITLTSADAVIAGAGATQKLTLRAKARGATDVPITADRAGSGVVKIAVSGPGGYALERSYTLQVRPPAQILARRTVKELAKGESVTLSNDMFADLVPGTGSVSVSVGSSTALDAAGLLAALDRYPYRCSEQITSRALPLLYMSELATEANVALEPNVDQRIRDTVDGLLARQGSNGSFGLWSPGGEDVWLDSYVTDFLTRARERKFAVPDDAFKLALDRLRNAVADLTDANKNDGTDLAYALYVLARNGAAPIGDLRYLADAKLDMLKTPIAKAQIAAALAMVGDHVRAERVYAAALADISPKPQPDVASREDYGSTLRDAAALVSLASEGGASGAVVQGAVQRVEAARAYLQPTSTQENAWLLLAASAMAKNAGKVALDVNGATLAQPLYRTIAAADLKDPLRVTNSGDDPVKAVVTVSGAPMTPEAAAQNGFKVERLNYTIDGDPLDVSTVKQNTRFVVVLKITEDQPQFGRVILADYLPAGFEIDNPHLVSSGDTGTLPWFTDAAEPVATEFRDDRFTAAFERKKDDPAVFSVAYIVRAVAPGKYVRPQASVEDMYRPDRFGRTNSENVEVTTGR
ncbi:MAG TPA: MG2 domain-containing protein [Xanthobacteraceae bacterium]|nr:MG2 domain-containing protein [Xanthobacteraceae bacterium]